MSIYHHKLDKPDNTNSSGELRNRKQNNNHKNTLNLGFDELLPEIPKEKDLDDDEFNRVSESDDQEIFNSQTSENEHDKNQNLDAETVLTYISRDNLNYMFQYAEDGDTYESEEARLPIGEDDENKDILVKRNLDIEDNTDNNDYQNKKTIAQGMMDIALLTANANQLRYVLESHERHPYFYPNIILIAISIIFQFAVGIGLILNYRCDCNDEAGRKRAKKVNDITTIGIYIITTVNCFISAFCVTGRDTSQSISADQTMPLNTIS